MSDLFCVYLRRDGDTPAEPAHVGGRVIVGTPEALAGAAVINAAGEAIYLFPRHCQPQPVPADVTSTVLVDDLLAEWAS